MKDLSQTQIRDIALETGLIDPDLSGGDFGSMVTDYGDAAESICEFVRKIAEAMKDQA